MLVLTRKTGEKFYIGDEIVITVLRTQGNQVRIGISAPKDVKVYREEIYREMDKDELELESEPETKSKPREEDCG